MTREAAERAILDKLKEIREILHQYDAGSTYLVGIIDGSRLNCYNDEFRANVKPIDCYENDDGFHSMSKKGEHDDAEGDLED